MAAAQDRSKEGQPGERFDKISYADLSDEGCVLRHPRSLPSLPGGAD